MLAGALYCPGGCYGAARNLQQSKVSEHQARTDNDDGEDDEDANDESRVLGASAQASREDLATLLPYYFDPKDARPSVYDPSWLDMHGDEAEETALMLLHEVLAEDVWNARVRCVTVLDSKPHITPIASMCTIIVCSCAAKEGDTRVCATSCEQSAPSSNAAATSLGRQHATMLEQEALVEIVGTAFEVIATLARVRGTENRSFTFRNASCGNHPCGMNDHHGDKVSADKLSPVWVGDSASVQVALRLSLFPLLERLGDRSATLSSAAEITLCRQCVALGEDRRASSVSQLLGTNADFLLDSLGLWPRPLDLSFRLHRSLLGWFLTTRFLHSKASS